LIIIRVRHFEIRAEDVDEAIARKTRKRQENKDYFNDNYTIRKTEIKVEDLVLRHDTNREVNMSSKHKLEYKWMGPCKVWYANPEHGTYRLMEIDGTVLKGTFPGRRLKRFEQRRGYLFPDSEEEGKGEGERGVKEDLSSNDDRDELSDLIKGVEVTEGMEVEGEVPARPVIQLPGITSQ